jgi:hypothetical protein
MNTTATQAMREATLERRRIREATMADHVNHRAQFSRYIWERWLARDPEDAQAAHLAAGIAEFRALMNPPAHQLRITR